MADILQITFSRYKMFIFLFKSHWSLVLRGHFWQGNSNPYYGLALNWCQAITWTNDEPDHWLIYAPPSLKMFKSRYANCLDKFSRNQRNQLICSRYCHWSVWNSRITLCDTLLGFCLTHWGWDKITTISHTSFSNAYSWIKMFEFQLKFHWSLFPRAQLTQFCIIVSDNGLAPNRRQGIFWPNDG